MEKKLVKRVIDAIYKERQENPFTEKELSELKAVMKTRKGSCIKMAVLGYNFLITANLRKEQGHNCVICSFLLLKNLKITAVVT